MRQRVTYADPHRFDGDLDRIGGESLRARDLARAATLGWERGAETEAAYAAALELPR